MQYILAAISFVFIWSIAVPYSTNAAGIRNISDGWLLPAQEMVELFKYKKTGEENIKGLTGVWADAGSMQLFAMPELPVISTGVGIRIGTQKTYWALGWFWQRTGQDNFQADYHLVQMQYENSWRVNIQLERKSRVLGNIPETSWLGAGVLWSPPPMKTGNYTFRSEIRVPLWATGDWREHEGRQSRFKAIATHGNLALVGVLDKKAFQGWALGLELSIALDSRLGISVRSDPDTGSFGPGTIWMLEPMLIKTSHIVHPELGVTHRVSVTVGSLGSIPW